MTTVGKNCYELTPSIIKDIHPQPYQTSNSTISYHQLNCNIILAINIQF